MHTVCLFESSGPIRRLAGDETVFVGFGDAYTSAEFDLVTAAVTRHASPIM